MAAGRRRSIGPSSPAQLTTVRRFERFRRPIASAYCFHSGSGACPSIRGADLVARSAKVRANARRCAASNSVGVTVHVQHAGVDPVRTRHDATRSLRLIGWQDDRVRGRAEHRSRTRRSDGYVAPVSADHNRAADRIEPWWPRRWCTHRRSLRAVSGSEPPEATFGPAASLRLPIQKTLSETATRMARKH